jgi:hypothetical protein
MIFRRRLDANPSPAAVCRPQHETARANGERAPSIKNVKAVESRNLARGLAFPSKAAIRRVEDYAVCSHSPAVNFIRGETDSADRIPLWQRVLPLPLTLGSLGEEARRYAKRNEKERNENCYETQKSQSFSQRGPSCCPSRFFAAFDCCPCVRVPSQPEEKERHFLSD